MTSPSFGDTIEECCYWKGGRHCHAPATLQTFHGRWYCQRHYEQVMVNREFMYELFDRQQSPALPTGGSKRRRTDESTPDSTG